MASSLHNAVLAVLVTTIFVIFAVALWFLLGWVQRKAGLGSAPLAGMSSREFLQKMFSEPTGQPSFGRGSFGFVIVCVMALIAYQIVTGKTYSLEAWAWFLLSVGGVTYMGGKVTTAWGANKIEASSAEVEAGKGKAAGQ